MAKKLTGGWDEVVPTLRESRTKKVRKSKYDQLLDGKVWVLEEGVDFAEGKTETTRISIRTVAKSRGVKLRTAIRGTRLYVQAVKERTLRSVEEVSA